MWWLFKWLPLDRPRPNASMNSKNAGDYSEAYYFHGLAVQTAEATAEYLHRHIRRELGLADGQGKRYSWGYPAIPELDDHRKVFDLLPVESELGMSLTPAYNWCRSNPLRRSSSTTPKQNISRWANPE